MIPFIVVVISREGDCNATIFVWEKPVIVSRYAREALTDSGCNALRPTFTFPAQVIHRDGVTCAHLVRRAGSSSNNNSNSRGCNAAQAPHVAAATTAVAAAAAAAPDGRSGGADRDRENHPGEFAQLSLCTSSKDGLLKVCSLEREVRQ